VAKDLSILIPSAREMFLKDTVEDLLRNIEMDTDIIVTLDGTWADPPLVQNDRVNVIYVNPSIGQRAATNLACRLSQAKYVMKVDAHCAFDKGFDRKMIEGFQKMGDDVTMVPVMRNLHAFDWKCHHCGFKSYQGPTPTVCACGSPKFRRKMIWEPRKGTHSISYTFDSGKLADVGYEKSDPHFQYSHEYKNRDEYKRGAFVGYRLSFDKPSLSPRIVGLLTNFANSHHLPSGTYSFWSGENVPVDTVGLSPVNNSWCIRAIEVLGIRDKLKVGGITTTPILAEMVENGDILPPSSGQGSDKPRIGETMGESLPPEVSAPSITADVYSPAPIPTTRNAVNFDVVEELNGILGSEFIYNEKTSSFHNGSVSLVPIYCKEFTESCSLQGSAFMCTRDNYWKWEVSDENAGSWGNQGIEVALATWLSGGRVLVNHNTWYAHMFRTQGGDFGFPWDAHGRAIQKTKFFIRDKFWLQKHPTQIHPVSWLIEKFLPINYKNNEGRMVPAWPAQDLEVLKTLERVV
jgi:hypothetical protein